MRIDTLLALPSLLLVLGACSDEDGRKPCPAQGLGVASIATGKSCKGISDPKDPDLLDCQEQLENARDYDCKEPQLCFDSTVDRSLSFIIAKDASAYGLSFILNNCSTGNQKLVISKVDVMGDSRCSFEFDYTKDVQKPTLAPGEQTLVQNRYNPKTPGEDHSVLVVHSNAQNFPDLRLFTCGTGIPKYAAGMDSGAPPYPDLSPPNEAGFAGMACKDQTTPSTCK